MQKYAYPKWQRKPVLLTKREIKRPETVLQAFFESYDLPACRDKLWELLSTAAGSNGADFYNGSDVGEWIFFHRRINELLEACWLLEQQQKL
jgi:hypothetical protein